jgi:S-adenosylmethionine/arginine decarboxylase-like enzyme
MLQHNHLIVRATLGNCPDNPEWVREWLENLVDMIGMKILAGPIVARVDIPGNVGCTGVVVIETSHVCIHLWEEIDLMQLDVYTCGPLNKDDIWPLLECLEPKDLAYKWLDREHGLTIVEQS